jgi:hypothetical protein
VLSVDSVRPLLFLSLSPEPNHLALYMKVVYYNDITAVVLNRPVEQPDVPGNSGIDRDAP